MIPPFKLTHHQPHSKLILHSKLQYSPVPRAGNLAECHRSHRQSRIPQIRMIRKLKNSVRNRIRFRSVIEKVLHTEKSQLKVPGPRNVP
jgi:hypothetical protein